MTNEGDDRETPGEGPESLVLAAFEDPEPLTVRDVAETTGIDAEDAETALDGLVTAGRLGRKAVGDVVVWYPTPGAGNGTGSGDRGTVDRRPATGVGDGETTDVRPTDESEAVDWSHDEVTVKGGGMTGDEGETGFDDAHVESAVADLDVPGTSEMMRDWRRAAVRASFDYLRGTGEASSGAIVEAVYSGHRAGYSDRDDWWACVAPRLETLPGVERDGDDWTFAGVE